MHTRLEVAPHKSAAQFGPTDETLEGIASWYRTVYDEQAKRDQQIADQLKDPTRFPGREWRGGRGAEASKAAGREAGQLLYSEKAAEQRQPVEESIGMWPGVSASHRRAGDGPEFSEGGVRERAEYRWVPLARRVDLDRVLHAMLECPQSFERVRATGSGDREWGRE